MRSRSREQKCEFLKGVQTTFFREWRNAGHVKCRYRIIGRLISIEILWKSFHPNTLIKSKQALDCVHHPLGLIYHHLSCPSLSSLSFIIFLVLHHLLIPICSLDQGVSADHLFDSQNKLPSPQSFQNYSKHDHHQVWLFRVIRQDFQPSSHNHGKIMTCWC